MTRSDKPKLAMYGAAGCGGCEVSVLNIGERILMIDRVFEIVFFPCIADFKYRDLQAYPDGYIDLCLFDGAIRSTENEELARQLRRKSRLLVAFGSCAAEGCVPGLANLSSASRLLESVYLDSPSVDNPRRLTPTRWSRMPEGELPLPALQRSVRTLAQVVDVDYTIPGCPPEPPQVWAALDPFVTALVGGGELPPKGAVVGCESFALCEECPLERRDTRIERFVRPHEVVPDPSRCLLEQGIACSGIATRGGCGALCPQAGMPCRGCYGGTEGAADQGARLLSALASAVGAGSTGDERRKLEQDVESAMSTLADPAGTLYRFSLARSLLHRARSSGRADEG